MLKTFSMLCILSFCFLVGICFFHNDVTTHADVDIESPSGYDVDLESPSGYCGHCMKYWDDDHWDISYQKWECPKWLCGEEGYDEVSSTPNTRMSCWTTYNDENPTAKRCYDHEQCSICGRERDDWFSSCKVKTGTADKCTKCGILSNKNISERRTDFGGCDNRVVYTDKSPDDCAICSLEICGYDWRDYAVGDGICLIPIGWPGHTYAFHAAMYCETCDRKWIALKYETLPVFTECSHNPFPTLVEAVVSCEMCPPPPPPPPDNTPYCDTCTDGCSSCPEMHPCGVHPKTQSGNHNRVACYTQNFDNELCQASPYACAVSHDCVFPED